MEFPQLPDLFDRGPWRQAGGPLLGLVKVLRQLLQPALGLPNVSDPSSPEFHLTREVEGSLPAKGVIKSGLRSFAGRVGLPLLSLQFRDAVPGSLGLLPRSGQGGCTVSDVPTKVADFVNGFLQPLGNALLFLKCRLGLREDPPGLLLVPLTLALGFECRPGGSLLRFTSGESLAEATDPPTEVLDGCEQPPGLFKLTVLLLDSSLELTSLRTRPEPAKVAGQEALPLLREKIPEPFEAGARQEQALPINGQGVPGRTGKTLRHKGARLPLAPHGNESHAATGRSEEHTSELQSPTNLV